MRADRLLTAAEAASRLGVSAKALRVYERRGLIAPRRSAAGWRVYGTEDMRRAAEIVALRGLGLSLAQVAQIFEAGLPGLKSALAVHQGTLHERMHHLAGILGRVAELRDSLAQDEAAPAEPGIAFDLPWPWGGERFALGRIRSLNFITGPLGSGKTRFARCLAESLPDAAFIALDRPRARLDADPALTSRVDQALTWLADDGAVISDALTALITELESDGPAIPVIDMIEQGLDQDTQEALMVYLRRRHPRKRPLFLLTRSNVILDLAAIGPDEAIILCPANHSPPVYVSPCPGTPGYEAVATCLACPDVRARTQGVIAWRPEVA